MERGLEVAEPLPTPSPLLSKYLSFWVSTQKFGHNGIMAGSKYLIDSPNTNKYTKFYDGER